MHGLPVTKLTLYKHGVGFFQRQGPAQDGAVTLSFRLEEMNDVLKSLTTLTVGGGQVLGLDYESPEDKSALLQRSSIHLSDAAALRDLLRDLRGRAVEIATPAETFAGVVIGIDLPGEREEIAATLVSLFAPDGKVTPIELGEILEVTLRDDRALGDLTYVLGANLTDQDKRAITVRLTPDAQEALVSYIAPSPTWRVSYRLIMDETDGEDAYQALLQGWGHFDNTLDEDLDAVQVKLVAGMPISFIYDLYEPFTPERPTVKEEQRTVAAPVEFEAPPRVAMGAPMQARGAMAAMDDMANMKMAPGLGVQALGGGTAIAASGQATGDYYSYVVSAPVNVRRGNAAVVPILQFMPELRKERIYNGRKHPGNPVVTARFRNDTSLTLERGPITVMEAGEYAGEAILPFTQAGGEVYLPYAVDLGVRVTEQSGQKRSLARVSLKQGFLVVEEYLIRTITYRLENRGDDPTKVLIEQEVSPDFEPFDTPEPEETTLTARRYAVEVPAHATNRLVTNERQLLARREEIKNQSLEQLRRWLQDKALDEAAFKRLSGLLSLYDQITEHEAKLHDNDARREAIHEQQGVVQGNLGALRTDGEEGKLRARYARTLSEQEDQLAALATDDAAQRAAIEKLKAEVEAELAAL